MAYMKKKCGEINIGWLEERERVSSFAFSVRFLHTLNFELRLECEEVKLEKVKLNGN
jgi:hypothetical protein